MKVYVIAWNYAYEGYGEPQKAFATLEEAEKAIEGKEHQDPTPEIFELEVEGPLSPSDDVVDSLKRLETRLGEIREPVYEYGTRWTVKIFGKDEEVTYPEPSLRDAEDTIRIDQQATGSSEPRGTVVRRIVAGDWEEVE